MKSYLKTGVLILLGTSMVYGQAATPAPATPAPAPAPATQAGGKTADQLDEDFQAARKELGEVMPATSDLLNASKRAEAAPKVVPVFRKMAGILAQLKPLRPALATVIEDSRFGILSMLSLFGDQQADKELQTASASKDPAVALMARTSVLLAQWWKSVGDAAAQGKVLDDVEQIAKAHGSDGDVAGMMQAMMSMGSTNRELKLRVMKIVTDDLSGDQAEQLKARAASLTKMFQLEGKPLVIEGALMDGKKFSSGDWKGKVVLVDFWATWCGPCVASLPELKKIYSTYHDKGLEVVGISNDQTVDALKEFVAKDSDMKWPQLFDPNAGGQWHSLSTKLGVEAIPAMFIIDRKGNLRTVEGREDEEGWVSKLVAEAAN